MRSWLTSLFKREDLAADLTWDSGTYPSGHLSYSTGWYKKVVDNPFMSQESRNQSVIGSADGVPMFKGISRSVTPAVLRAGNLPDHKSMHFPNAHLWFLYPNEYWSQDDEGKNKPVRAKKKAHNLTPLMVMAADDLLMWEDGQMVCDYTKSINDPKRTFKLRVVMLYWVADYPGHGEVSGFNHEANHFHNCHWCRRTSFYSRGISRQVIGDYRR
jgi:hypothetical protein